MTVEDKVEAVRIKALALYRTNYAERLGSHLLAGNTALIFRDYAEAGQYKSVGDLLKYFQEEGAYLCSLYPSEFVLRNILCAALKIVREEAQRLASGSDDLNSFDSLTKLWIDPKNSRLNVNVDDLRKAVMSSLEEFSLEMRSTRKEIANQAVNHVLPTDTVLTYQFSTSSTLNAFFEKSKCCILSVDDKKLLAEPNVKANYTPMEDVLTVMPQVTRVVLSAVAVLPDGSCVLQAGSLGICLAANRHSVPVLVIGAFYKFTPIFLPNVDDFNATTNPTVALGDEHELLERPNFIVNNPLFDHIPSKLVTLYVTQSSAVSPPHVYRLLGEFYHHEDLYHFKRDDFQILITDELSRFLKK
ncbi:unnamed protein product [Bursaphelenchus xylophilus]|uniref:Translation initiation factor eIF2B subunit beta n=1 Tax=Bursaphelenchus xylophilus TaxID=6326 RepID=A0A7I8WZ48_BURXY|nr:unnamed protein product [Bursaphelenchus xylophilus]CAG9101962.1 unnamed protein product [Bursaphelenchus xylophilus]